MHIISYIFGVMLAVLEKNPPKTFTDKTYNAEAKMNILEQGIRRINQNRPAKNSVSNKLIAMIKSRKQKYIKVSKG